MKTPAQDEDFGHAEIGYSTEENRYIAHVRENHIQTLAIPPDLRSLKIEDGTLRHPRSDNELYGHLDEDEREIVEYRFELNECFFNGIVWRMFRDHGRTGEIMMKIILLGGAGAIILGIYFLLQQTISQSDNDTIVGVIMKTLFAMPPVLVAVIALFLPAFGYFWGIHAVYQDFFSIIYVLDGHKRVIRCHYPTHLLTGRADRLTTGEFVMTLPRCCEDNRCDCPPRLLYERDLEHGLKSAASVGVTNASAKFEFIERASMIARNAATVPIDRKELATRLLPYALIIAGFAIGAFLLFNSGTSE